MQRTMYTCLLTAVFHLAATACTSSHISTTVGLLAQHLTANLVIFLNTNTQAQNDELNVDHIACGVTKSNNVAPKPVGAITLDFDKYLSLRKQENTTSKHFYNPLIVIVHQDERTRLRFRNLTDEVIVADSNWLIFINTSITSYFHGCYLPFNMLLLTASSRGSVVELHEVYHLNQSRPLTILTYGQWSPDRGLQVTQEIIHKRRRNLDGIVLRTGSTQNYPINYFIKNDQGQMVLDGYFPKIWQQLEELLNFSSINYFAADSYPGTPDQNGTWDGLIGMLHRGQIDVAVAAFIIDKLRTKVVDFSRPLLRTSYQVFYKKRGDQLHWNAVLQPFSTEIWATIVLWSVVSSTVLSVCHYCSLALGIERSKPGSYSFCNSLLFFSKAVCSQGHPDVPSSLSCRIIFVSAYLVAGILLPSYSASLLLFLTSKTPVRPFDTLSGLLSDGTYKLLTLRKSAEFVYFERSQDELRQGIFQKILVQTDLPLTVEQALDRVCADSSLAFFGDLSSAHYYMLKLNAENACDIITFSQPVSVVYSSVVLARNSPYGKIMNYYLQRMDGSGVMDHIMDISLPFEKIIMENSWKEVSSHDVTQIFMILLLGMVCALVIFVTESIARRMKTDKVQGAKTEPGRKIFTKNKKKI